MTTLQRTISLQTDQKLQRQQTQLSNSNRQYAAVFQQRPSSRTLSRSKCLFVGSLIPFYLGNSQQISGTLAISAIQM